MRPGSQDGAILVHIPDSECGMPHNPPGGVRRRGFLTSLGALTGLAVLRPGSLQAEPLSMAPSPSGEWDLSWLNQLRGKHRQVFDLSNMEIRLVVVRNWFDAHETVYGLKYPGVNAVIGIGGHAFPINASDELYRKFPIGELWKVTDPETGQPAVRNPFLDGGKTPADRESTVRALQARGAIFWQVTDPETGQPAVRNPFLDGGKTPADRES